jgi:uncharacterized protein (DUF58 family)
LVSRHWPRLRTALKLDRFLIGSGPEPGPVDLHRRRVYILPSGAGFGFGVLLLLLLLGSINYGNNLGFLLTFLLGGTAWVTMHHTYRNLVRLRVAAGHPEAVFAGQTARFPIVLDTPAGQPRYALHLEGAGGAHAALDVADRASAVLEVHAPRRGRIPLGRFTLSSGYPLGLFRAWAHVHFDLQCIVYPRPAPPGAPPPAAPARLRQSGEQGRGSDDFSGVRGYQPGDSSRHVYWKGVARSGVMLTKLFGGNAAEELWLDWSETGGSDDESRLEQLCRWVLDAEAAGCAYGLRMPGREIAPDRGERHREQCLTVLALHGYAGGPAGIR